MLNPRISSYQRLDRGEGIYTSAQASCNCCWFLGCKYSKVWPAPKELKYILSILMLVLLNRHYRHISPKLKIPLTCELPQRMHVTTGICKSFCLKTIPFFSRLLATISAQNLNECKWVVDTPTKFCNTLLYYSTWLPLHHCGWWCYVVCRLLTLLIVCSNAVKKFHGKCVSTKFFYKKFLKWNIFLYYICMYVSVHR